MIYKIKAKLCQAAIERRLGDISELPKELVDCVFNVYRVDEILKKFEPQAEPGRDADEKT
ncbi:hypothetical protein ACFL2S_02655 [Thermodesulfobacteriota bacterium]